MNTETESPQERVARILLVEDNPGDILLTRHALKQAKIVNSLTIAMTGEQGLLMLNKEGPYSVMELPDIILLDLNLPGISGHEVLKTVKNDKKLSHIPVIILSSSYAESDIKKTNKARVDGYLTKPLNVDHFSKMLHTIESLWFRIVIVHRSDSYL